MATAWIGSRGLLASYRASVSLRRIAVAPNMIASLSIGYKEGCALGGDAAFRVHERSVRSTRMACIRGTVMPLNRQRRAAVDRRRCLSKEDDAREGISHKKGNGTCREAVRASGC